MVDDKDKRGCLLYLVSAGSARRESYCWNELQKVFYTNSKQSLDRFIRIFPVTTDWTPLPTAVTNYCSVDLSKCLKSHAQCDFYRKEDCEHTKSFSCILDILETNKDGWKDPSTKWMERFTVEVTTKDLTEQMKHFVGRQKIIGEIKKWVESSDSKIKHIEGLPGIGKTLLVKKLERELGADAVLFCDREQLNTRDPSKVLEYIALQLGIKYPCIANEYNSENFQKTLLPRDQPIDFFRHVIRDPLAECTKPNNEPYVILIDALDEASNKGDGDLVHFISNVLSELPNSVKLIVTSRPQRGGIKLDGNPIQIDRESTKNDIRKYFEERLPNIQAYKDLADTEKRELLDELSERSEGIFLYAELMYKEFEVYYKDNQGYSFTEIDKIPHGLENYFLQYFERRFPTTEERKFFTKDVKPVLQLMVACQESLKFSMITKVLEIDNTEVEKIAQKLGSLFLVAESKDTGESKTIRTYHTSVSDWLQDANESGLYHASLKDGHNKLAEYGRSRYPEWRKGTISSLDRYFIRFLPYHLRSSEKMKECVELQTDLQYLELRIQNDPENAYTLMEDYRELLKDLRKDVRNDFTKDDSFSGEPSKSEADRLEAFLSGLIQTSKSRGEVQPAELQSVEIWDDEKRKNRSGKLKSKEEDYFRVRAFSDFVSSELHSFTRFGHVKEFVLQQAFNWANGGPVSDDAEKLIRETEKRRDVMLLQKKSQRPEFTLFPAMARTYRGQDASVQSVSSTPDCRLLLTGSQDSQVGLWDIQTGRNIIFLGGHDGFVEAVDVSADGKRGLSGGRDKTLRVWDLENETELNVFREHEETVTTVCISPDGRTAVSGSEDRTIRVWDLDNGHEDFILHEHRGAVNCVAMSADGQRVLSGSADGSLIYWDLKEKKPLHVFEGLGEAILSVSITPDGRWAVSGSEDSTVEFWDLCKFESLGALKGHTRGVLSVKISADGTKAVSAAGYDKTVFLWDLETKKPIRSFRSHVAYVFDVAFSPDARFALTGSRDRTIRLWDLQRGEWIGSKERHREHVSALAVSPCGNRALSGSWDSLRSWNLQEGKLENIVSSHEPITKSGPEYIKGEWRTETGLYVRAREEVQGTYDALVFGSDNNLAASGSIDSGFKVWSLGNETYKLIFEDETKSICSIACSPDGRMIVTGGLDGTLLIWDMDTREVLHELKEHQGAVLTLCLSPDGKSCYSGGVDHAVIKWDLRNRSLKRRVCAHTSPVRGVTVSPDGVYVISVGNDGRLLRWDPDLYEEPKLITGTGQWLECLGLSADGYCALVGSRDMTLSVWNLTDESDRLAVYQSRSPITRVSSVRGDGLMVCGNGLGEVLIFTMKNYDHFYLPAVTAIRRWMFDPQSNKGHWDDNLTVRCPHCGQLFVLSPEARKAVEVANEQLLTGKGSASANMADFREDESLKDSCTYCNSSFRYNPFIVDNSYSTY